MTVLDLVKPGSPILKTKTELFDFAKALVNPVELYQNLANTMLEKEGIGLAAPQCGLPYRVFVIHSDPILGIFNPRIVDVGEEEFTLEEGCLTYPGLLLKISRPRRIKLRFTEANGETKTEVFHDMTARIIQHETMHLDGVLFSSLASRLQLEMAIKKAKKLGYNYLIKDLIGD